jgi:adenylylsulfate kinase
MTDRARGYIVWFTGLSGAGKTTLARGLRDRINSHRRVEILDGDEVRTTLCSDLGYSKADRDANVLRIGYVARLLARNGVATLVAAITPYREARNEIRQTAINEGVPFVEVFVDASLDVLIARDAKGLYAKALAGSLAQFTGISDPYEPPEAADIRIRTDRQSVAASLEELLTYLQQLGLQT